MDIAEIKRLVEQETLPLLKKQFQPVYGMVKQRTDPQDYHETYQLAINYRDRVRPHSEISGFPEKLFQQATPNETPEEALYIRNNYKQTTLSVYSDYHQTINRTFNDGNYDLIYQKDEDQYADELSFQYYVEHEIRQFGSLENLMKSSVSHLKGVDANGVIAIKPESISYINNPENDNELIVDTSELLRPQPYYYRCDQVMKKELDEWYLILLDEKSLVSQGDKQYKIGFVFEFYDENQIVRITQVGKYAEYTFEYEIYFYHNEGVVPVHELKGIPQIIDNKIVWMSPFLYACENLDIALVNSQYLQASIKKVCYPLTVMVGDTCTFEERHEETGQLITCNEGKLLNPSDQSYRTCPKCSGSGLKVRLSPFGVLLLRKEDWTGQGDKAFSERALYHVSPDPAALEFVRNEIELNIDKGRKMMHLYDSNSQVKGNETATFIAIDMKAMYAFIKPQSNQLFDCWRFMLNRIGWQRYAQAHKKPQLTDPDTFDYNTESDYMYQIGEAQKAGLPPGIIYSIILRYLSTLYFNTKKTTDVLKLLVMTDRLLVISQADISAKVSKGLAQKWESILHDSAIIFIDQLSNTDEKFFEKTFEDQQKALIDVAKQKAGDIDTEMQAAQDTLVNNIIKLPTQSGAAA